MPNHWTAIINQWTGWSIIHTILKPIIWHASSQETFYFPPDSSHPHKFGFDEALDYGYPVWFAAALWCLLQHKKAYFPSSPGKQSLGTFARSFNFRIGDFRNMQMAPHKDQIGLFKRILAWELMTEKCMRNMMVGARSLSRNSVSLLHHPRYLVVVDDRMCFCSGFDD